MKLTGNSVDIKKFNNDQHFGVVVIIDNKIAFEFKAIDQLVRYVDLYNARFLQTYYRDLADNDKQSFKSRFMKFIDDAVNINIPEMKRLFKQSVGHVFFWKDGKFGEPLTAQQLELVVEDLIKLFNTNKNVHDLSKKFGYAHLDPNNNTIRKCAERADEKFRARYKIDDDKSILNKLVTVKE